ncbi:MAG: threonine ammonia-lyase [Halobacteriovoraceae bacterium]|nr:threonine ammonia-lyase [Halobacteriovoraceae bacterium]|tara:strand:- start:13975 stop:15198 length:1224 start_codon:yes stop_codon:yes gene_type:complete
MKLELKGFEQALENIRPYVAATPLIKNEWLSKKFNCEIFLKLENMQPVGSFKLRGATNFMAHMTEEEKKLGVLAVSAGNHAQGVAWAAEKFGLHATIIMPTSSPLTKISNTEALGASVILKGENVDESFEFAKEYLQENKKVYIHPFNHENVVYGQGTIAYELKDQLPDADFIFGSIGGGGLMAGIGVVAKSIFDKCTIVGCQSTGAASMIKSLQQGKLIESETVATFADGIKVKKPYLNLYETLDSVIDEAIHVSDDKVAKSLLDLIENARIITEGAGAINLAAFEELYERNPRRFKGKKVVLVICGGNIDINLIDRIIDIGLMESKRRVKMKVILEDKPGGLNLLTEILSTTNANVLQVYHLRDEPQIQLNQSMVEVIIETKGEEHTEKVFSAVREKFEVIPWGV